MKTKKKNTSAGQFGPELHWDYRDGKPSSLHWGDLVIFFIEPTLLDNKPYYRIDPHNFSNTIETAVDDLEMVVLEDINTDTGAPYESYYMREENYTLTALMELFEKALAKLPYKMVE
jgi:hypothetical protein